MAASGDARRETGSIIGGEVGDVSEQTNVIAFPLSLRATAKKVEAGTFLRPQSYEFTEGELAALCRWFSAMKYAFPGTEGVMIVSHQDSYSAIGLYSTEGRAPNCLIAKHEVGGITRFFWSTETDPPRVIEHLSEITDAHIRAIQPPRNEKGWLDPAGWMGIYASRLIATALQVV
ncbi:MAG TPA: hypothetical protein VND87_17960 [Stellaceae bacterium]|nr:hypothetical protein [Stellaceae bacterium]